MLKRLIKLAKNLLAISWVRRAYELVTHWTLEAGALNRLTATLYAIGGLLTFNREQYAVLRGRREYYRNLDKARISHVELRRNIHRLEKGMSMRPLRPVFAKNFIGETLDFYVAAIQLGAASPACRIDEAELTWAQNVLARYFEVVDTSDPAIAAAQQRFELEQITYQPATHDQVPFARKDGVVGGVTCEQLLTLSEQRRSVRWFLDKPVPRELIDKALLVGRQAPTACNRLPYEYLVFDDPALVRKVAAVPVGTAGYRQQIPTIIVVKGNLDSYFSPRDRHTIYIDAALAAMGFMLALETLGLASTVVNWPDFEPLELKMSKTLGLAPHERVIMLIAVGYPDPEGMIPSSPKKPLNVLRSYNPPLHSAPATRK
ncbi:MAG: nitroreductase family protein [Actinomycetia bacterium]|nr:nitroreductase family protein [Actinomycetes bacterium]